MFENFFLIAGPCVLEGDDVNLAVGEALASLAARHRLPVFFKSSFDKANRSKLASARGPGLEEGLRALERVKANCGLPVLTDIHEPAQAPPAAEVADIVQIPAFLCRQTDLLTAAGRTGSAMNIKKGQWMSPEQMAHAVHKARAAGAGEVAVTERGTFFGYGDQIIDMRSFARVRSACGTPVVFDGTHSVQRQGHAGGGTDGNPEFIACLVRAAVAAGCDGLFLEVHPAPATAPSDSSNMLELTALAPLLEDVLAIRGALS